MPLHSKAHTGTGTSKLIHNKKLSAKFVEKLKCPRLLDTRDFACAMDESVLDILPETAEDWLLAVNKYDLIVPTPFIEKTATRALKTFFLDMLRGCMYTFLSQWKPFELFSRRI